MAGTPAPGRPRSLITEADRERLVARLGEHYARGELELDDLSRRVEVVLAATYLDQATAAVANLPQLAGPAAGRPHPARPRGPGGAGTARRPGRVPGGCGPASGSAIRPAG